MVGAAEDAISLADSEDQLAPAGRGSGAPLYQQEAAQAAAEQAGAGSAAVRYRFIARQDASGPPPPMARILRGHGGRGGTVRLELYLSLLWLARNRTRDRPVFAYPAQQLAALLGLPSPQAAGARRIHEALRWLAAAGFVALDHRRGSVTRVHLLDDAGSGDPYQPAGGMVTRGRKLPPHEREKHFYVQLPAQYWTNGWVTELSGAATAMYLACLYEQRGRTGHTIWISPAAGRDRYDLSDETRNKGLRELTDWGLLELARRPVPGGSFFDERFRARNVYLINNSRWNAKPRKRSTKPG